MRKKEVKKEYAPLVSETTYEYPKGEYFNVVLKKDKKDWIIQSFRCPKCGHVVRDVEIDNVPTREITCPECGFKGDVRIADKKQDIPYMAKIFKMADGSIAVSFLVKRVWFFYLHDMLIYKTRTWRARLIFNKNGHTYYKGPVFIKSGRRADKMSPAISDVTYSAQRRINFVVERMFYILQRKGLLDKDIIFARRFPNLGQQCKDIMKYLCLHAEGRASFLSKTEIAAFICSIKLDATDEDMLSAILKKMRAPKSKAFLRMFYQDPWTVWNNWAVYKNLNMKDINSFYKFGNNNVDIVKKTQLLCGEETASYNLAVHYIQVIGESAFADILADNNKYNLFSDAATYAISLISDLGKDIAPYLHNSIKKTHDALQEVYQKEIQEKERKEKILDILEDDQRLKAWTCTENPDAKRAFMHHIMLRVEQVTNNKIRYSAEERAIEYAYGNIEFYLPPDTDHLLYAGEKLHNCVGNLYRINALHHESLIVLMKQANKLVGCIEVCNGKIRQAYGPCNRELSGNEQEAFMAWKKAKGFNDHINRILYAEPLQYKYDLSRYNEYVERVKKKAVELNIKMPVIEPMNHFNQMVPF